MVAVGYYFSFNLSYCDAVEIMADREVRYTIQRSCAGFTTMAQSPRCCDKQFTSQSWRVDETYIKVNGNWNYLYHAIDKQGLTLDFSLREQRDYLAAYHFLKRLLKTYGRPNCLVTDPYGATLKAIKQVVKGVLMDLKIHQCSKYRNNLIEQDHRFIKRHRVQSAGFQNVRSLVPWLGLKLFMK